MNIAEKILEFAENQQEINEMLNGDFSKQYENGVSVGYKEGHSVGYENGYLDGKDSVPNPLEYATNPKYAGAAFPEGYELTIDIPNVMSLEYLFYGTTGIKKVTIKGDKDGRALSFDRMFTNSSIEVVDMTDFGIVPTILDNAFYNATKLREIIGVVDVRNCASAKRTFTNCSNLEELRFLPNSIAYLLELTSTPKLSAETIQSLIEGLSPVGGTLRLHSELVMKLTQEQLTEIFNKNWSVQ